MKYGYVRVSTKEQNEQRQMIALRDFGIPDKHIFVDKQSGRTLNERITSECSVKSNAEIRSSSKASIAWEEIMMISWPNGES